MPSTDFTWFRGRGRHREIISSLGPAYVLTGAYSSMHDDSNANVAEELGLASGY